VYTSYVVSLFLRVQRHLSRRTDDFGALSEKKNSIDRAAGRFADYLLASKHAKADVLLTTVLGLLRGPLLPPLAATAGALGRCRRRPRLLEPPPPAAVAAVPGGCRHRIQLLPQTPPAAVTAATERCSRSRRLPSPPAAVAAAGRENRHNNIYCFSLGALPPPTGFRWAPILLKVHKRRCAPKVSPATSASRDAEHTQ